MGRYAKIIEDPSLPFGPVTNYDLFSNHWLERRLQLEPEWQEFKDAARNALLRIAEIWEQEKDRVEKYEKEATLEEKFIQPVLRELGWKLYTQPTLTGGSPDYALFLSEENIDSALRVGRDSPDFWKFPVVVADAKAWHVSLSRPTVVGKQKEFPPEQIERYLLRSRLEYGILTNGKKWRLIPRDIVGKQRFQTYLECDLPSLLKRWKNKSGLFADESQSFQDFLKFYLFFGPTGFTEIENRKSLIQRAKHGSSEHRLGIGDDLRDRVFEALRLCIEGFLKYEGNGLSLETDLPICREKSFTLLYRLLFIMSAEDRGLLPYHTNRLYTETKSLGHLRGQVADRFEGLRVRNVGDFPHGSADLWEQLQVLFILVDAGHQTFGVPAYDGGLFDPESNKFLLQNRISDWYMARVIDQLGRAVDRNHRERGLYRVDYRDLQIRHLGTIYESLLELHPEVASVPMKVVRRKSTLVEKIILADQNPAKGWEETGTRHRAGEVYLLTAKGERRASGSYYTPNHIVDHIVHQTLSPLCRDIGEQLEQEIQVLEGRLEDVAPKDREQMQARIDCLRTKYDDRVLSLRILDPSMGSGHFLLRACQYLAEEIATHKYTADPDFDATQPDESAITFWKRRVAEHCLYGVDLNPMAVELAKLALWLETISEGQPLTFLDHRLHHGNSLVGATVDDLGKLPHSMEIAGNMVAEQIKSKLPDLLDPLEQIQNLPSNSMEQVEAKKKLHKQLEKAEEGFLAVADLWCSAFFLEGKPSERRYQAAVQNIGRPRRLKEMRAESWFNRCLSVANSEAGRFFHWELEFPWVFLDGKGQNGGGGFDAIIGNPPYDVLSEKEIGHSLKGLKNYIASRAVYQPSLKGKNNLFKLFVCRSVQLLADGGRLGFIVPMALLGDEQAVLIRRLLLGAGALRSVEAFPQKDKPKLRVFPEAKLSTTLFTFRKMAGDEASKQPFVSRTHPANEVVEDSPPLELTTPEIPLYDESNLTIVSCAQADWDLAVRIMASGRMGRLREHCEFFQGEVNQTNARKGGFLTSGTKGKFVTRGAGICLYVTRDSSQGDDLYIDKELFLAGKGADTKVFHHKHKRVCLQESSPQNNFRRLIAAIVPSRTFFNHTVNYTTEIHSRLPLDFVLAILNSKLADWYFRLGSTNNHVNHYQIHNLPCPVFREEPAAGEPEAFQRAEDALNSGKFESALKTLSPLLVTAPFSPLLKKSIAHTARRIVDIEEGRGSITRSERAKLAPQAQPLQDLIDALFYSMAGLSSKDVAGLEQRLEKML